METDKNSELDQWLNFTEGYAACIEAAFYEGYDMDECPYEDGSCEKEHWKTGWAKARDIIE